jgi:hypothetical protein
MKVAYDCLSQLGKSLQEDMDGHRFPPKPNSLLFKGETPKQLQAFDLVPHFEERSLHVTGN